MIILAFDTCAIIFVLIFLLSTIIRKQFSGRTNLIMFAMMVISLITACADAFYGATWNYAIPTKAVITSMNVFVYIYFLGQNLVMSFYVLYLYSSFDLWHLFKAKKRIFLSWHILTGFDILLLLINPFSDIIFKVGYPKVYTRGPLLSVFYITALIFLIWSLLIVSKYRKIIDIDKIIVVFFLASVIVAGTIIQLFDSSLQIIVFSVAVGFLFFMVIVRRSENQIDPITGAIKYNEGIKKVSRNFITKKPVSVVLVKITNIGDLRLYLGQERFNDFLYSTTTKFRSIMRSNQVRGDIFYLEQGLFSYLIEGMSLEKALDIGRDSFRYMNSTMTIGTFEILPKARACVALCPKDIDDFGTLSSMGTTFHLTMPDSGDVNIYSDYKNDKNFKIMNNLDVIIERGLKNHSFYMNYQPIYSMNEKKYVSAEALIRLKDEEYGEISPGIFIPFAETNGSIHEIGDFVLETVIKFASDGMLKRLGLDYIELNLSAAQCIEVDLVDKIRSLLEKYNVSPSEISLELTETAADINPQVVDKNIEALHDFGVRIALDDYGTGYSNIKRVTALPIDQVKLDRCFVNMLEDPNMYIVTHDTINMLKEMGKEVLIEGVEEQRFIDKLNNINADLVQGCELVQGFFYCQPLSENTFIAKMASTNV